MEYKERVLSTGKFLICHFWPYCWSSGGPPTVGPPTLVQICLQQISAGRLVIFTILSMLILEYGGPWRLYERSKPKSQSYRFQRVVLKKFIGMFRKKNIKIN